MTLLFHLLSLASVVAYAVATLSYAWALSAPIRSVSALSTATSGGALKFETAPPVGVITSSGRKALAVGLFLHLSSLILAYAYPYLPGLGLDPLAEGKSIISVGSAPHTLSLISGFLAGLFLLLERRLALYALGAFVAPLALLVHLCSAGLFHVSRDVIPIVSNHPLLLVHISTSVLAHALFVFAFVVSVALILSETSLKNKTPARLIRVFPSLCLLDDLNLRLLTLGFWIMLFAVITGTLFGIVVQDAMFNFDVRFIWSFITLSAYAVLLLGRRFAGLRGRRAAWLSVVGFATVVASFISLQLLGGTFHVY